MIWLDTPSIFGYKGIKEPVWLSSSGSENFSIVGFLNSTEPVFLTSGIPAIATASPFLNLVSIYWGPNHFALISPVSSLITNVAILNLDFVVNTETFLTSPKIVISLVISGVMDLIFDNWDLSICLFGKNLKTSIEKDSNDKEMNNIKKSEGKR